MIFTEKNKPKKEEKMTPDILNRFAAPVANGSARYLKKSSQLEENNNNHKDNSNNNSHSNGSVSINESHTKEQQQTTEERVFKPQIRWPDLIAQIFIHAGFLYGLYYLISLQAKFYTYIWCKLLARIM